MDIVRLIEDHRHDLTPAERRVADVVLADPQRVAFGTVAEIAAVAQTGGATVIRLASRLGLDGFSAMQSAVQSDVARRLRPATERIREPLPTDVVGRALAAELDNVHDTLNGVDREVHADAVRRLANRAARVFVLSGEASRGVGVQVAHELALLRDRVRMLEGSPVRVAQDLAFGDEGDVVLAIDLRRYERWVVDAATQATERGMACIAVTDSLLSPLAAIAVATFVVRAEGAGPFDSHVGTLAVANTLVAGVAARLTRTATARLDAVEAAWQSELVE